MVYPCNGILFIHKRNEVLIHATVWEKLENIMLKVRSQTQRQHTLLYAMSRICKFIDPESRLVTDNSSGGGGLESILR